MSDETKIAPRLDEDGEPVCGGKECPDFIPAFSRCDLDYCNREGDTCPTTCVPGLRRQRDEKRADAERLREESAEAFADFLVIEGVLIDYGSNVGRETPESALARFRAALTGKEPT